jgi:hypothetical protein
MYHDVKDLVSHSDFAFHEDTPVDQKSDDDAEEMERLCLLVFDRWCEQRNVIPLAYLLHAWPISMGDSAARNRLLNTLGELRQFHPETLRRDERLLISQLVTMLACALDRGS